MELKKITPPPSGFFFNFLGYQSILYSVYKWLVDACKYYVNIGVLPFQNFFVYKGWHRVTEPTHTGVQYIKSKKDKTNVLCDSLPIEQEHNDTVSQIEAEIQLVL